ncbi:S-layer homology domain-containing protein [Paenibacillus prosopidis]|uniref:S-layer family protein n=1 Tax=Paenibacillus prosopidis TaxID=630520 RepID=A0A368W183_9BACL|nr:S-layer homology domain-containing protein [Paenibacillus prosopidis]RCW47446.1 S-layer family protein [Paenibacillus prosopidis]
MKKIVQAFMVAALLVSMLVTTQVAVGAAAFTDTKTHWAKAEIDAAAAQGWIKGYTSASFKPDADITRAEFLKSLVAAMKYKLEDTDTPFEDDKGWFRAYIATGLKQSVIKIGEYKELTFEPNRKITREEIARMTLRAAGKDKEGVAFGYLAVAKQIKIMSGYPDGTLGGNKNATRAEAVVMITNTLNYINLPVSVAYPKSEKELNTLIHSLPSFKGNTMISRGSVGINSKGTDVFEDNTIWIEYDSSLKQTFIFIYEPTDANKAIVKDLLKFYYPISYEKAYSTYIKINGMDYKNSNITTKYDGRTFEGYKGNSNKTVGIVIGA